MKFLNRIVEFILLLAILGGGFFITLSSMTESWWRLALYNAQRERGIGLAIGGGLLAFGVIYAASGIKRPKRTRYLSYDGEEGTTSISTEAIEDYIARLSSEFPSVMRMRPEVLPRRQAIDINVELKVKAGPQIHEACELMQSRIREAMSNGLGISDVRRVEITVKEIASEHKPV